MRRAPHELNQIPTEFHEDGASELPELPDEFNRFPRPNKPRESSRLRKIMLLLAAAGLTVLGVFALQPKETKDLSVAEAQPTPSVQTETEAPVLTTTPTAEPVKASPSPTEMPIPTETAIPSETPKETPTPTPGVSVSYYYRASEVYYAMLIVSVPEKVSSVSFQLAAPDAEEPALEI